MARRIYHKKKSSNGWFLKAAFGVLVCGALWFAAKQAISYFGFNPDKIVEKSMFKDSLFQADVKEIITRDGIKAYYLQDKTNPIISLSFLFKNSGSAYDDKGEEGIANLVAELLVDGAGKYDADKFQEILEQKAIVMSFQANKDDFVGGLKTITSNKDLAAKLLRLVLSEPRFEREDIERAKKEMLTLLKQQQEFPQAQFSLFVNRELFGEHPYGRNMLGVERDILALNREKLKNFVQNHFSKNRLIVGIVGDISEDDAKRFIDRIFANLPETGQSSFVAEARVDFEAKEQSMHFKAAQNMAQFVAPSVKRSDSDFYPLYIANEVFAGQGLSSRLSKAVREDKGLTYGVYNYLSLNDKAVMMQGGFSSTPENYDEAKKIVLKEWAKMGKKGVKSEEFELARNYLLASFNLRFASIDNISATLVAMQRENLGKNFLLKRNQYIQDVTLEDVNQAAAKYFIPQKLRWFDLISVQSK